MGNRIGINFRSIARSSGNLIATLLRFEGPQAITNSTTKLKIERRLKNMMELGLNEH